jgi:hypothetical protein
MKLLLGTWAFIFTLTTGDIREIEYNGKTYPTIYGVEKFNGKYAGDKAGFLELRPDGTGTYVYDIFGIAPADCIKGPISFEYGFLVDENNSPIKLERDYGWSYPVLFKVTGETAFQGCRTKVMLDFILEKKDGSLHVSSSDNWVKQ